MNKKHYAALDGLRGVVALLVAVTHAHILLEPYQPIPHGYLAVDFFFILSGFVIADAYEERLRQTMSFGRFVIIRFIRLYPMLVLGTCVGAVAAAMTTRAPISMIVAGTTASALVLPFEAHGMLGYGLWPLNGPAWSLFWEIVINFVFAMGLFRCETRFIAAIMLVGAFLLLIVVLIFHSLEVGYLRANFWGGLGRVLFGFTAGIILNRLYRSGRIPLLKSNIWLLSGVTCLCLALPINIYKGIFDLFIVMFIFPIIIIYGINTPVKGTMWNFFGQLSYPFYMIHAPILTFMAYGTEGYSFGSRIVAYFAFIFISLFAALSAMVLYDEPVRAALSRVSRFTFLSRLSTRMER